jgi:conjugal transfer/entry exclusion protein
MPRSRPIALTTLIDALSLGRRCAAALAAAWVCGGALAPPAHAQFGLPTLVSDPVATGAIVANGLILGAQRRAIRDQIRHFRNSLRAERELTFREIDAVVAELESFVAEAGGLGYSLYNLEEQFNEIYDRGEYYVGDLLEALDRDLEQVEVALATVEGTLLSMQGHMEQLHASADDLLDYQAQLERAGLSPTQIEQIAASVRAYGTQEVQLLRQALLTQVNQEAVVMAAELNDKLEAARSNAEVIDRIGSHYDSVEIPPAPSHLLGDR